MKKCTKCQALKLITGFDKNPSYKDGYSLTCIQCCVIRDKKRSSCRILPTHPAYCNAAMWISDARKNPKADAERKRKYRFKNKHKYKAQCKVNNAIRDGKITREPCQICGSTNRVHAHHDNYSRMLAVRWLCPKHHKQWHTENGQGAYS